MQPRCLWVSDGRAADGTMLADVSGNTASAELPEDALRWDTGAAADSATLAPPSVRAVHAGQCLPASLR